jgi:mannose-6-phosphate isomerase-like protein (cupin superfamily)
MAVSKYAKNILTELKMDWSPEEAARYAKLGTRIFWMDNKTTPGAFQMNCSWYLHTLSKSVEPHTHDVDEIIGFFGNDDKNPYDLHGEVEIWLGDEKQIINKSALVFVPAGMRHCPLLLNRVDRPIFCFSVVTGNQYVRTHKENVKLPKTNLGKYVITELKEPEEKKKIAPLYTKYAKRVLWLDKNVVPGAFHMNTAWYLKAQMTLDDKPHTHDHDEIIGFFGNDSADPYNLHGEIEIDLEGEKQVITKSAMIFVPAGMKHCPLNLKRVNQPIFHFTVVTHELYIKDEKGK